MRRFSARLRHSVSLIFALALMTACTSAAPPAPTAVPATAPTPPPTQAPVRPLESQTSPAASPAAAASPVASPAAGVASPAAQPGGNFTVAQTSDAVSFHPFTTTDTGSHGYQGLIYAGDFWEYDPDTLQPKPAMAKSWTVSADKLTYTFTLRDGLKWSDGQPLTSADYKWTFDQAVKPENKYPYISNLDLIDTYEAPNPQTVVVKMKEAVVVGFEAAEAVTPLPKHIWEKYDWSDPSKNPEIMKPTVFSGPFKLREWQRDDHAVFEANPSYWEGRPFFDTYTVRIVPSPEIAYQMLKTGEVDQGVVTPDNYNEAKNLPNVKMYEWWPAAATWRYLGFNLRRPLFQDVQVRRAISYAINRNAIASQILNNLAQPTYSVFPPSSWVYNPNVPKYEYDPAKAKETLEAAGIKAGPNGMRQTKDGKPIKLRILFGPQTSKTASQTAVVTQQWLKDVGLDSEVQGLEWGSYLSSLQTEPFDWDINVGAWQSTIEPHWMNQIWGEESIPELNHVAYVNKQVEQLFDQGSKEFDFDKRKQIYQQIQQIISEDAPYVFLTYDMGYTAINSRIGGIVPTKLGISYNLDKWYVK